MPAPRRQRRATVPALDIDAMRTALAAGRLVRVSIAPSGQFPDGATGRVKAIGDPTSDGDEYLSVEVGSGSNKDTLPFAPADLLPYRRNGAASQDETPPPVAPQRPRRQARAATAPAAPPAPAAPAESPAPTGAGSDGQGLFDTGVTPPAVTARRAPRATGTAGAKGAATPVKGKRPPISIVVASDEGGAWTVQAKVGARVALRSTPLSPARVAEFARLLDEPALVDAVDRLLDDNRKAVQAHADALAAELARVQAELDSYLG